MLEIKGAETRKGIEKFRSYEGRFLERLTRIQDPPPHPLQYRDRESRKW